MRMRDRYGSASTNSLRDPHLHPIEDRNSFVKRSQTFSPSAVTASKSRYICRRSDSDSAMHLNITAAVAQVQPPPFRRGAVERRSLRRFHSKVPRLPLASELTNANNSMMNVKLKLTLFITLFYLKTEPQPGIAQPRTCIDLELDWRAQQSRLESLNDDVVRLRELKRRLEQARDSNDVQVAAWALENEDFKNLVDNASVVEDRRLQKLLRKTAKDIYKLRKTKVEKNRPDFISFK